MSIAPVFMNAHLARIRPDRFTLLLIAIAVLGTGLVLARQVTYGVSLWGDSISYISTARGLLAGEGLTELWMGDWLYRSWPPLYPMLLAAGSLGVFDPWEVAGPLNAICFGLTILVTGQWLRRHIRSPIPVIWGSLAVALSVHLVPNASAALSDAPFFLLSTIALSRFSAWLDEPRRSTLIQVAVLTALACLTRYLGVTVMFTVILILLLQRNTIPAIKVKRILGYGLLSGFPLCLWLIRNYIHWGTFTTNWVEEGNQTGTTTVSGILHDSAQYVGSWIAPGMVTSETVYLILSVALLLSAFAGFAYALKGKQENGSLYPFALFIPIYLGVTTTIVVNGAPVLGFEERHFLVIYVPFICLFSVVIAQLFRIPAHISLPRATAGISAIALIALGGWLGYNAKIHADEIRFINSTEYFRADEFNSESLAYLQSITTGMSWGNIDHSSVYFHAGKGVDDYGRLPDVLSDLPQFIAEAEKGDYIIWLKHSPSGFDADYTYYDLLSTDGMDFVTSLHDGYVLMVTKQTLAEKYATITSQEADVNSEFNVYLSGTKLSFTREPCRRSEILDTIYVHLIPRNISEIPRKFRSDGFENIDFYFRSVGAIFDGKCMATIFLPDYQITTVFTGVHTTETHFWRGKFHPSPDMLPPSAFIWSASIEPPLDTSRLREDYDAITSGIPVVPSFYSVWIDGPYISYTRDACEEADTTALFFLHIYPVDDADLPDKREPDVDFDNLDFVFERETGSVRFDGKCIATRMLPDYPIASIRTGQYDARGDIWSVDIPMPPPPPNS